ncbi:MAG TPA: hypothetical protein VNN07_19030 [Candidatus Tectomicrobia bacterium]|nr:hypothetical protein [Candidatus Tectomicrobia bacterium]
MSRAEALRRTEREIAQEKASALGRAGERLEAALAAVRALGAALDAEADTGRRAGLLAEYEAARHRALTARTALLIQREAVGLRNHRVVDQQYPEPPRRR